jgi:Cu/Ag efflux protein CusF
MKKIAAVLAVLVLVVSLASLVFAAETEKGTIKSVDAKSGMMMLSVQGKDLHLKADKSVDLSNLKAGDKVEASVEDGVIKGVKKQRRAPVGC